ncbi:MAG TPA: transglycosylase domain-containing protein [Candidatus Dormibacteraeota bacterium]|nr:transglycosylase domain-containing protein [Candidatus Dormibacteraeota bacterium]
MTPLAAPMTSKRTASRPHRRRWPAWSWYPVELVGLALAVIVAATAVTWMVTPSTADAMGLVAAKDGAHHTTTVGTDQLPRQLAEALIATEDASFYHDHGVNVEGIVRAGVYDARHRCTCEGGSTIAQQLAEDLYLNGDDGTVGGRWEDLVLTLKLETHLSSTQVLDAYASELYLGHGTVGVVQAAQVYFHRRLADLTLAQDALLAGLPQAPSGYDPIDHPQLARLRRATVLHQMVVQGYVTAAQAIQATHAPV